MNCSGRWTPVFGLLLAFAPGCQRSPTSALVTVQSDLGDDMRSVFVQVRDPSDTPGGESKSFSREQYGDQFSFGIVPKNAEEMQFVVVATALSCSDCDPESSPDSVLVESKNIGTFIRETTIEITLALRAACRGVSCPAGQTCSEISGRCVTLAENQVPGGPPTQNVAGADAAGSGSQGQGGQPAAGGNRAQPTPSGSGAGAGGETQPPNQAGTPGTPGQAGAGGTPRQTQAGASGGGPEPAGMSAPPQGGASGSTAPAGRILGDPCQSGFDCLSTYCADGICCQSACDESCSACNLPGHVGVCSALDAGEKPAPGHPACTPESEASCGRDGSCDGEGKCRLWKDVVCQAAGCSSATNSTTGAAKCDGEGKCVAPAAIGCAPFTCNAAAAACHTTCSASVPCADPNPCVSGSCGAKPNGTACSGDGDCTSGACVDGVCCNDACEGKCEACDLPATLGTCSPVASGQPHGGRGACAGTGSCAGACRSGSRDSCTFPGSSTACRPQSCLGSKLTAAASCNGAGACPAVSTSDCPGNLVCNSAGTACLTDCTGNADCTAGRSCVAGSCVNTAPNGSACTANSQCQSTLCIDGVCCNAACNGQCEACDVSGSAGTCAAVTSGQPHGSRAACSGTAPCRGACGAGSRTACTYPSSGVQCAAATCANETSLASARFCNGAGSCAAATVTACATNMCANGACTATCFVAGTPVDTATGLRAIETLRPGDSVRTYDELTGQSSYRNVVEVERRIARELVRVTLRSGASLTMSPEHQLWVQDTGWVRGGLLNVDDSLLSAAGTPVQLDALETLGAEALAADGGTEVFNVVVEASPTYFVGDEPVLVHSCDYLNFSARTTLDTPQ